MPNNSGSTETARLMRDIGNSVGMSYSCNGSSADTKGRVASAFTSSFGYSSARYADYNSSTVIQQIRNNRPVILRGGRKSGWWIFSSYADGHAWVCDGYRYSLIYSDDCQTAWGYSYFHMNWGWNSTYNGWFSLNNWNPGDYTFNYKRGMVYDIIP